jgi:uncharacterized protein (UPF0264 family)
MARLLVSIRTAAEATRAVQGGAALLDVKEPSRGSLGRADPAIVAAVVEFAAKSIPVSAAMGELLEEPIAPDCRGLAFAKWGLSGWRDDSGWWSALSRTDQDLNRNSPGCRLVAVAYADWQRALAPRPEDICRFACSSCSGAMLIDTWQKDGTTLLDWLSIENIAELVRTCRRSGVAMALAGSLGSRQIERLAPLDPDWFAVRGAACRGGRRGAPISAARVRRLAELAKRPSRGATPKRPCLES